MLLREGSSAGVVGKVDVGGAGLKALELINKGLRSWYNEVHKNDNCRGLRARSMMLRKVPKEIPITAW